MTLIRSLVEMAAAQICGNCRQPMTGNHFYRKINGQNKRFCKKDAIQKAVDAGYQPSGNVSFPLGGNPPVGGTPTRATSGGPVTPRPPATPAPPPPPASNTITRPQLENWLKDVGIEPNQYEVINGKLNIKTSVHLVDQDYTQLPLPFGKIDGDFEVFMPTLKTFKNFPNEIKGNFIVMHTDIENFDELDIAVDDSIYMNNNKKLKNFRKIHKNIRSVDGDITVDLDPGTNGGLGLLLIPGLEQLKVPSNSKITEIMNQRVTDNSDILDIQEELIDAGFKKIARI